VRTLDPPVCSAANSLSNGAAHFWLCGSNSNSCDCKLIEEGESKNIKGYFSGTGCQDLFIGQGWVREGSGGVRINPPGMSLFLSRYRRVHMTAPPREWWEP